MREHATLSLFLLLLGGCLALGLSIYVALVAGWLLLVAYGLSKGCGVRDMLSWSLSGIIRIRAILITFMLIGMMTAAWRIAGTIPYIAASASSLVMPGFFYMLTFLLCGFMSTLTGTSFGSAATMGLICMTVSRSMGLDAGMTGGAILSGVFVGDRWSPMSTSALLVATLTETDIYANIRAMVKTAWVPFLAAAAIYMLPGLLLPDVQGAASGASALFARHFILHPAASLPAVMIIVLSLFKVKARLSMAVSILVSIAVALLLQRQPIDVILRVLLTGYRPQDAQLARMLSGGGLASMVSTAMIVCLSATYSGLFEGTGLLSGLGAALQKLSKKTTPFFGVLAASAFLSLIGFNQTLPIMLTHQLCKDIMPDRKELALALENTAVVIPPLVPWSIAGAVPLATVGAGTDALPLAFFLYLVPLWQLVAGSARRSVR